MEQRLARHAYALKLPYFLSFLVVVSFSRPPRIGQLVDQASADILVRQSEDTTKDQSMMHLEPRLCLLRVMVMAMTMTMTMMIGMSVCVLAALEYSKGKDYTHHPKRREESSK